MEGMQDFLKGLSAEDAALVTEDFWMFGRAVVEVVDGKKRRVPLGKVVTAGGSVMVTDVDRA
jgi:hypothetical protein